MVVHLFDIDSVHQMETSLSHALLVLLTADYLKTRTYHPQPERDLML
jgi:hypothetical protein